MRTRISILATALLAATATGQRVYVDANIAIGGNGNSWANAYKSLSAALSAASFGDTLWVAQGTYTGGFVLPAGVSIVGGFASGDMRMAERDIGDKPTILDGNNTTRVVELGQRSSIDGVWVQRGRTGSPGGAGILALGVQATVRNCVVSENNITGGRGSSIYTGQDNNGRRPAVLFENVFVVNNGWTTSRGHNIDFEYDDSTFRNCVVDRNFHNGLHMQSSCTTKIYNSVFTNNSGRGLCHIDPNTRPVLESNLIWNNRIALHHYRGSDLRSIGAVNALTYAKNNITGNPQWTDPANGDYSLQSTSPLIDAGIDFPGATMQDLDGNGRRIDGNRTGVARTDIGAIEYSNVYLSILGSQKPGTQVTFDTGGLLGSAAFLALGVPASTPTFLGELGFAFVDLSTVQIFGWPAIGNDVKVMIPSNVPVGTMVHAQVAAGGAAWGNLSSPEVIRVR